MQLAVVRRISGAAALVSDGHGPTRTLDSEPASKPSASARRPPLVIDPTARRNLSLGHGVKLLLARPSTAQRSAHSGQAARIDLPPQNLALRTYQRELLPQLGRFDARLAAISPQAPDQSLSTAEKAELSFTVLSDPASRIATEIGIAFQQADDVLAAQRQLGLDLAQVNAEGATRLPRPTVLVVDRDRVVRFVEVQPDYRARTEVADIVAALAALS